MGYGFSQLVDVWRATVLDLLKIFRDALPVEVGPFMDGPVVMLPTVKHIKVMFRLYGDFKYERFAPRAVHRMGEMLKFEGPIRFWRLPGIEYYDDRISFRELRTIRREAVEKHPPHVEVVFDCAFQFNYEVSDAI